MTIAVQLGFVTGALVSAALNVADVFPPRIVVLAGAAGAAAANAFLGAASGAGASIPESEVGAAVLSGGWHLWIARCPHPSG